jgi:hypothetical protein
MAAKRERGDDPEVAAASSQRPEQVRVRVGARGDKATVRQYHGSGDDLASNSGKIIYS